jgi:hypothetical protein
MTIKEYKCFGCENIYDALYRFTGLPFCQSIFFAISKGPRFACGHVTPLPLINQGLILKGGIWKRGAFMEGKGKKILK